MSIPNYATALHLAPRKLLVFTGSKAIHPRLAKELPPSVGDLLTREPSLTHLAKRGRLPTPLPDKLYIYTATSMAQLYELLCIRKAGWLFPKYQHAFGKHPVGSLRVTEEYVPDLHRHSLMARLLSPGLGHPVEGILDLYDVRLLHWTSDLITLVGFERMEDEKGLRALDCAQTWVLRPARDD